jgi:DNA-binding IclR family transcriptional regulator
MADAGPRSPLRTVQVLHTLAHTPAGLALARLASELELPKTSLFRLLRALESGGYVTSGDGVYRMGPEALKLGTAIVGNRVFPSCARPVMQQVFEQCRETVIIGTRDGGGDDVVYSEVIEGTNPLRFSVEPGTIKPLYCSASGLSIIAHMLPAERQQYFKRVHFIALAPRTIGTVAELRQRVQEIRRQGHAVSVEGMFEGVYSVAAPIVDAAGGVRAGISISCPTTRGLRSDAQFTALVRHAGEEISRMLGYTGAYPPGA